MKKIQRDVFLLFPAIFLFLNVVSCGELHQEKKSESLTNSLDALIRNELVDADQISATGIVDAGYILGGSQQSLLPKFKIAARLYHQGKCKKLLILHTDGKTEYSRVLGRNLTNDEWALLKVAELTVPKSCVEFVKIRKGFFGTFAEARGISEVIKERRYNNIVLITSAYHTHRTRISFQNFLKDTDVALSVIASKENGTFMEHLVEFIKLRVYELFLVS